MTMLRELQPGLWLTELELEDFDVRGAVLLGSRRAVVWDTLSHPRDMAGVSELVAGRPLSVVYSHADWDHVWGTAALRADEVVGHATCLERFSDDVPATLKRKLVERPQHWGDVRLIPPNRTFQSDLTIELGDLTLVLHHLPGHTPDCCVGFIPERGLLLMGDCVETPLPVVNAGSPFEAWIAGLAAWAVDERVHTVIPAHGPVGGRELVTRTIAYLSALLSGESPEAPAALTDFYRETHERNQRHAPRCL
jgi:glyoxylase-like metal-dependent hydrolase (beta-lactamase superfamily II)